MMLLGKQERSGGGGFRECQNAHMQLTTTTE